MGRLLILCAVLAVGAGAPAWAQVGFDALMEGELEDSGGWNLAALLDPVRMGLFAIESLIAVGLASAIAFHPVNARTKARSGDLLLPRLYMLYGLIGVSIGFLVGQHGYLIGFVVFGIGGLLRFRSSFSAPEMTAEVILVTIIGLSVGLNLPVIAAMITLVAWAVIWMTGTLTGYTLNIHCTTEDQLDTALDEFRTHAERYKWRVVSVDRSFTKPKAEVLFQAKRIDGLAAVRRQLKGCFADNETSWRLET
jgi:hypothetical protein